MTAATRPRSKQKNSVAPEKAPRRRQAKRPAQEGAEEPRTEKLARGSDAAARRRARTVVADGAGKKRSSRSQQARAGRAGEPEWAEAKRSPLRSPAEKAPSAARPKAKRSPRCSPVEKVPSATRPKVEARRTPRPLRTATVEVPTAAEVRESSPSQQVTSTATMSPEADRAKQTSAADASAAAASAAAASPVAASAAAGEDAEKRTAGAPQSSKATKKEVTPVKKKPYRAVHVNTVDAAHLVATIAGRPTVVGIDVAKEKMCAGIAVGEEVVITVKWSHPEETPAMKALLDQVAPSAEIVLEPSGTYGHALMHYLREHPIYVVNGKRTHDAREVFDGVPSSHDGKSCAILVRLHAEKLGRRWEPLTEGRRDMKAAVGRAKRYQQQYQSCLNELEAQLAYAWPELTKHLELTRACVPALLAAFPGPQAVREEPAKAALLLRETGRNFLAEDTVRAVISSASETLGTELTELERDCLRSLAEDAVVLRGKVERAKDVACRLTESSATAAALRPMTGAYTAAVLVAAAGEVTSYPHVGAYVKALGLNLREASSGNDPKGKGLRITKRGPSEARRVLYLLVLRVLQDDAVVRAWYARKVARDGGKKMKALVAVMRKLARALWHVGRGAAFDARRLFDVRLLDVSPEASDAA